MFTITQKAADVFQSSFTEMGDESLYLRVAARLLPETGMQYNMGFDQKKEGDTDFEDHGIKFIVDTSSQVLVTGMMVDFGEHDGQEQLIFANPNDVEQKNPDSCGTTPSSSSCGTGGCGSCS